MQKKSREFPICHLEFGKLIVPSLPERQEQNELWEHRIQSPPPIIKQLPKSLELRISQLSANEKILKNWIKPYKEALTKAGYKHKMWYQQNIRQNATTTKHQKRNIIWFNPPLNCQCCDNSWKALPFFIIWAFSTAHQVPSNV